MDRQLIAQYRAGAPLLAQAITGLSREQMSSFPVPGSWSIQQIVLHLMDSDLIATDRMKRVIAEENPTLIGFDESKFARHLFYDQLDAQMAAEVFRLNRLLTAGILERLPDDAFSRRGQHNEAGPVTLEKLARTYVDHLAHHLKFIQQKRDMLLAPA